MIGRRMVSPVVLDMHESELEASKVQAAAASTVTPVVDSKPTKPSWDDEQVNRVQKQPSSKRIHLRNNK